MMTPLVAQMVKYLPTMWETWVRSLGWEDPLEKEMAPHSSTLAWRIPWMKEPRGLQSMGSQRVWHDWATSLSLVNYEYYSIVWIDHIFFVRLSVDGHLGYVYIFALVTNIAWWRGSAQGPICWHRRTCRSLGICCTSCFHSLLLATPSKEDAQRAETSIGFHFHSVHFSKWSRLVAKLVKNPPAIAEDPDPIPGPGRSPGEGIGYPLQYSWASLGAQLVKNLSAMQETWVRSLAWEDPLENVMATHSSILA